MNNNSAQKEYLSIVIVSMNNLGNLLPCLKSIYEFTCDIVFEIYIVAYLFTDENLSILKQEYPDVVIIESNSIRGYAENNNLALKKVDSKFTLVLNDDTYLSSPIISGLISSVETYPDPRAAIISPIIKFEDGSVQYNGREKREAIDYIKERFGFSRLFNRYKYSNKTGIYQSYNITGACFLIKTEVFKELGFFDETYFFCPEDIALSTLANEKNYIVLVDTNYMITHVHHSSSGKLESAIHPVTELGGCMFYGRSSVAKLYLLKTLIFLQALVKWFFIGLFKRNKKRIVYLNVLRTIFTRKSTKEIFIKLYSEIN